MSGYGFDPTGIELDARGYFSLVLNGQVYPLKGLGFNVTGYVGAGLPPIEAVVTPFGIKGGNLVQRQVPRPRTIALAGTFEGDSIFQVNAARQRLLAFLTPNIYDQSPKDLYLQYQLPDQLTSALRMPVIYVGGLEGNITSNFGETVAITFVEENPPSVTEVATVTQSSPNFGTLPGSNLLNADTTPVGLFVQDPATGQWSDLVTNRWPTALNYRDSDGLLYYGCSYNATDAGAVFANMNGTFPVTLTHTTPANAIVNKITNLNVGLGVNQQFVGGNFTSPYKYLVRENSGAYVDIGTTLGLNGQVTDILLGPDGYIYLTGDFTAPGVRFVKFDPISNVATALGTGLTGGIARAMTQGLDRKIYIVGDFTACNGVACNGFCSYDPVTNTYAAISGLTANIQGTSIITALDGSLVLAGIQVGLVGGISSTGTDALGVVMYRNGQFISMDGGLLGTPIKLFLDKRNGDIYATGPFSTVQNNPTIPTYKRQISNGLAKYNGSRWVPLNIMLTAADSNAPALAIRSTDGQIAVGFHATSRFKSIQMQFTYGGTAEVNPTILLTGPGAVLGIVNYTNGRAIYFDMFGIFNNNGLSNLYNGETVTVQPGGPNGVNLQSNQRGNMQGTVIGGSNISSFTLMPGVNNIQIIAQPNSASAYVFSYKNTHWSFDAGSR